MDRGIISCGCSACPKWKEWQWEILVKRQAKALGYNFLGFPRGFYGCHSMVSLECDIHGKWDTGRMSSFLDGHACPLCAIAKNAASAFISDSFYIERAYAGESYKKGTVLIPGSDEKSKWTLICPSCSVDDMSMFGIGPSSFKISRKGMTKCLIPCRCSPSYRMTTSELEHKASVTAHKKGYEFLGWQFKDLKRNTMSMLSIGCSEHGPFRISFSNFVYHEKGCASCAKYGFKPDVDGYVYALKSECGAYMKIGITNKPEVRIAQLSKATPFSFSIDGVFKTSGVKARTTERAAHIEFMSAGLSGFDGCTEWLRYDPTIVEYVEQRAL